FGGSDPCLTPRVGLHTLDGCARVSVGLSLGRERAGVVDGGAVHRILHRRGGQPIHTVLPSTLMATRKRLEDGGRRWGDVPTWHVGDRIAKARRHAGISSGELAKAIGVSRFSLSGWEHGRHEPSSPIYIYLIGQATGVDPRWIDPDRIDD